MQLTFHHTGGSRVSPSEIHNHTWLLLEEMRVLNIFFQKGCSPSEHLPGRGIPPGWSPQLSQGVIHVYKPSYRKSSKQATKTDHPSSPHASQLRERYWFPVSFLHTMGNSMCVCCSGGAPLTPRGIITWQTVFRFVEGHTSHSHQGQCQRRKSTGAQGRLQAVGQKPRNLATSMQRASSLCQLTHP